MFHISIISVPVKNTFSGIDFEIKLYPDIDAASSDELSSLNIPRALLRVLVRHIIYGGRELPHRVIDPITNRVI